MAASYGRDAWQSSRMRVLGFMTGTSSTPSTWRCRNRRRDDFRPSGRPASASSEATRDIMLEATKQALAWPRGAPEPAIFAEAARVGAEETSRPRRSSSRQRPGLVRHRPDRHARPDGLHERPKDGVAGRTVQLAGPAGSVRRSGGLRFSHPPTWRPAGRAPLAPIYHLARAQPPAQGCRWRC